MDPGPPVPPDPPDPATPPPAGSRPRGVPPRSGAPSIRRGLAGSSRAARSGFRAFTSLWQILRANPLSLVGFVLVVLVGATAGLVELAPGLLGIHYPLNRAGAGSPRRADHDPPVRDRPDRDRHLFQRDGRSPGRSGDRIFHRTVLAPLRRDPRPDRRVLGHPGHPAGVAVHRHPAHHRRVPLLPEPHPRAGHRRHARPRILPGDPGDHDHLVAVPTSGWSAARSSRSSRSCSSPRRGRRGSATCASCSATF